MTSQFFTAQGTAENGVGKVFLQHGSLRPITNDDQFHLTQWVSVLQGLETALEQSQVLFLRQSSYMQYCDLLIIQCPAFAQSAVAFSGVEQLAVDASGQHPQALKMPTLQFQTLTGARYQGQARAVVKPAQVMGDHATEQAQAVLVRILLKVGMKAADDADSQPPRRPQSGQSQRPFGGDIQHIRALPAPASEQFSHRRLAPLQPWVTG